MINNSLIKVQVKEYTSPAKPQRRLIYQRIKPYMDAYGISPEFFEIKGKSVVFKNNNPNNITQLNKSVVSIRPSKKKQNQKISVKRPQTASIQLSNNVILPISNKYANLFNEIKTIPQKPQVQQPQKVEQSLIVEEADEASDSSYIKKHELMLKDIAELEKQIYYHTRVKQEKILELEMLQNKIDEAKNVEINSSRFIIKKNVHKPTLREKKDKAASLIQAHVKGRIDYKRFIEWKKKKEDKLRKVIFIQTWWKIQMKHLKIQKKFRITHQQKQVRLIDGHTFLIITNYSYTLYRIRLLFIERMGVIKGDFRLYLNQQNCSKLLNEDISKQSIEFVSLMNIIINNIIKLIQIQDSRLVFDQQKQNLIDIPRLVLQVNLNLHHITANQYSLNINQAEPEQPQIISKQQLESSDQKPVAVEMEPDNIKNDQLQEIKEDNYSEEQEIKADNQNKQIMSIQAEEENKKSKKIESLYQNVESPQAVIQKEAVDLQQQQDNEINNNDQYENQNQKVLQDGNDFENQKLLNSYNNQNNQSQGELINKENISQQNQEYQQNNFQQSEKEQKNEQDHQDDLEKDDMNNQQEIQNTNQIQFYALQDPLNSQISNQQNLQFQQYISDLKNDNIQNNQNKFEREQNVNSINNNLLETIKIVEDTQIIQNEVLSSQRTQKNEHQIDQQDFINIEQGDKEQIVNNKKEDIIEEKEQNQEKIIQIQSGDNEVQQQQGITSNLEDQQILEVMEKQEVKIDTEVVENKNEEFELIENKVDKPSEVKEEDEEEQQQIVISQYGNEQHSNGQSHKIEKEPSIQSFQKRENDQNLLQLPSQVEFHLLKSCESNFFEPPNSGKETIKYLNSGELLSRTNFLSQLGQLGKFEFENNSLLGSGDLKKDIEGLPEPLNLRNKSNNQQELFSESQTFPNRMPSDFRSPFIDDTFKLSTTFKFQFSSELKAFESGQFISQQFDIKVQQQDSLEYSMDESSDLQPIYITTIKVDDIDVDVFQIKNVLRFKDKNNLYQCYDFKISKMQQLNSDYIIQNLFVFIIKNRINCIDGNQIVRIQRYLKKFRFVQSCVLTLEKESTLICLFKSFFQIKMCIYRHVEIGEQIIIGKMTIKQRRILEQNFYSICPQLLFHDKGLEQRILATIEALGIQS